MSLIFLVVTMGYLLRKTIWIEWIILAVAAFLAYIYNIYAFAIAFGLFTTVYLIQKRT